MIIYGEAISHGEVSSENNNKIFKAITIEEAVAKALEYHPDLKKLNFEISAIEKKALSVIKIPEPMISVSTEIPFSSPLSIPEASFMVSQSFPLTNSTKHERDVYFKEKTKIKWMKEVEELNIRYNVEILFIDIAIMEEERKLLFQLLDKAQQIYDASIFLVSSGSGDSSIVSKSNVEIEQIKSDIKKIEEILIVSKYALSILTGMDVSKILSANFIMPPYRDIDVNYESIFNNLDEKVPELKEVDSEIESIIAMKKVAKDNYYPMMTVSGGYTYKSNELMGLMGKDVYMIAVGLSIPIWHNNYKFEVENIEQKISAQKEEKEGMKIKIKMELIDTIGKLKALQVEIHNLKSSIIPLLEKTLFLQMTSLSSGKGSFLEVLDSLRMLVMASMKKLNLEAEHAKERARYYRILATHDSKRWK